MQLDAALQLTASSLRVWADAQQLSPDERDERRELMQLILCRACENARVASTDTPLVVSGNFAIAHFAHITALPAGLHIRGHLRLENLPRLRAFPAGLHVTGPLSLTGLTALAVIDVPVDVACDLTCSDCPELRRFDAAVRVAGDVSLRDLPKLDDIKGLRCHEALWISACPSLARWPASLELQRLSVDGCDALIRLPEGLVVRRVLELRRCAQLRSLLPHVLSWPCDYADSPRSVIVQTCGVAAAELHLLQRQLPHAACNFSDSGVADDDAISFHHEPETEFHSLAAVYDFFGHALLSTSGKGVTTFQTVLLSLAPNDERLLRSALFRLEETEEYQLRTCRPQLAWRVLALLRRMAGNDEIAEICVRRLAEGTGGCGDRITLALSQAEVDVLVYDAEHAEHSTQALEELARRLLRLDVVYEYATRKIDQLARRAADDPNSRNVHRNGNEMVEVYLAYQLALRERLDLPIETRAMSFYEVSDVRPSDLNAAEAAARARSGNPAELARFLGTWTPWQVHLRRQRAQALVFGELPEAPKAPAMLFELLCPFTLEPLRALQKPALTYIDGHPRAYEFEELRTWWIQQGTEPTLRRPMQLDRLYRAR